MSYLGKSYHPPGTAPGTLAESEGGTLDIHMVRYGPQACEERTLSSVDQCRDWHQPDTLCWIQVNGKPDPATLRTLGAMFNLHELALEDVLNTGQRPKIDRFDDQLFVVLALPLNLPDGVRSAQISIFAGSDYLVCLSSTDRDPFEPIRRRLRAPSNGRFRQSGIDYLLYALTDFVIDAAFPVLESFGDEIELLEEELLADARPASLTRIHHLRRELLLLRRTLWPQREVVGNLMRDENALIREATLPFLRDCYDHSVQIIDLLESFREMSASLLEVYLSTISNRTNEVMRVLTIIATIFIPLTFIVGVYGMNFDPDIGPLSMPELRWKYGYPFIWLLMLGVTASLLWLFRRRKWL